MWQVDALLLDAGSPKEEQEEWTTVVKSKDRRGKGGKAKKARESLQGDSSAIGASLLGERGHPERASALQRELLGRAFAAVR